MVPLAGSQDVMQSIPGRTTLAAPPVSPSLPQSRPNPGLINDMDFWAEIFPEAMKFLNQDPLPYGGLYQPQWGIRRLSLWCGVQAKLDMARKDYDFHNGQHQIGRYRRKMRGNMDKVAAPLQQGVKSIPHVDIAMPVIGVIDLLLDVRNT